MSENGRHASPLVLGTRGSELALAQAGMVSRALERALDRPVERRIIRTIGDERQDLKLSEFSAGDAGLDKGIFIKELEEALRAGEIDAAVHSLKDVPSELEDDFMIAGVLPRAAVEDVLIRAGGEGGLAGLRPGARVATGSVRRQRMLKHLRPDLEAVEIRGNVPTRIRKLTERDDLDAILLARAGLERLGHARLAEGVLSFEGRDLPAEILGCDRFLPAASQGIIGIEIRKGDEETGAAVAAVSDRETFLRATAERAFLRLLQAGCQTPVGVHTWVNESDGVLHMKTVIFSEADVAAPPRTGEAAGALERPEEVARRLMKTLE